MDDILYKEFILDLYRHPLNKGVLSDYDATARDVSTSCGDDITIYIKFNEEGKVKNVRHSGDGCAISQAAVSLLTEAIKGKTSVEVLSFTKDDVPRLLGVPISYTREGCATLGLQVAQKALASLC